MKSMSSMFMNTKSAFATTNAGFACAQMPSASEAEYVMLSVGAVAAVSIFILPIIRLAAIAILLLTLRLWIAQKTK